MKNQTAWREKRRTARKRHHDVKSINGRPNDPEFKSQQNITKLEIWANAQRDGGPAEYRRRPMFNVAKFG